MEPKKRLTFEYDGEEKVKCRACGREIFFKRMESGKLMPVSYESLESHFADCPNASDFRKSKGKEKKNG